jgi:hypothetical protein
MSTSLITILKISIFYPIDCMQKIIKFDLSPSKKTYFMQLLTLLVDDGGVFSPSSAFRMTTVTTPGTESTAAPLVTTTTAANF